MPTKFGRVTSFGRSGPKFREAFLETGDRVELSPAAMEDLLAHNPEHALVFVERRGRLFHYVQWVGTPDEAIRAVDDGILRPDEVPPNVRIVGEAMQRVKDGTSTINLTAFDDLPPPGSEVARFVAYLYEASPQDWIAMMKAHATTFRADEAAKRRTGALWENGGQRGLTSGQITVRDVDIAKSSAESAADHALPSVSAYLLERAATPQTNVEERLRPALRMAANAITTLILIRPYLSDEEAKELWAPYATLMPTMPGSAQPD